MWKYNIICRSITMIWTQIIFVIENLHQRTVSRWILYTIINQIDGRWYYFLWHTCIFGILNDIVWLIYIVWNNSISWKHASTGSSAFVITVATVAVAVTSFNIFLVEMRILRNTVQTFNSVYFILCKSRRNITGTIAAVCMRKCYAKVATRI